MPRQKHQSDSVRYGGKGVDVDVYRASLSLSEMQALRRTLAKRANQRIVRLEKATSRITGERYNEFGAVTEAYDYLDRQSKGRKRFQERANALTDINAIRREISVLQGFLGRKTSLVSGIREIEQKRIETFESGKWGKASKYTGGTARRLKFASTKEFYNFLSSQTFRNLVKTGFTSEQIVDAYDQARVKQSDEEVLTALQEALDEYREGQKATLKDLQERFKMVKLT